MIGKLLRKNTSPARIAGFVISNLVGLAIMGAGLQFYLDARSLWQEKDSFLKSDYLAVNKIVDAGAMMGNKSGEFTSEDIADLERQPWVEKVGKFSRADFRVYATVALGEGEEGDAGRRMSTAMFFESVPDEFLDMKGGTFRWSPGSQEVPIIISKDYLALYNFGFASSAGLPQLSEGIVSGIPLQLTLSSEDGTQRRQYYGKVVGYSNRFNTILVPQSFLDAENAELGRGGASEAPGASRLIIDVNSPGDAAIAPYLQDKGWEMAGDKGAASAAYMLKIVSGIIIAIGSIITLLSLIILVLSMSLLMEKNRRKLHSLLMLGIPVKDVARPYKQITVMSAIGAGILAWLCVIGLRSYYLGPLQSLGIEGSGFWITTGMMAGVTMIIALVNIRAVTHRVIRAWRN